VTTSLYSGARPYKNCGKPFHPPHKLLILCQCTTYHLHYQALKMPKKDDSKPKVDAAKAAEAKAPVEAGKNPKKTSKKPAK